MKYVLQCQRDARSTHANAMLLSTSTNMIENVLGNPRKAYFLFRNAGNIANALGACVRLRPGLQTLRAVNLDFGYFSIITIITI